MTATPKQQLVERVAVAISQWMNCKKLPHPPTWVRLQESTREAYREQAQAAVAACRRRFKNLPERHFRSLEILVRQHIGGAHIAPPIPPRP